MIGKIGSVLLLSVPALGAAQPYVSADLGYASADFGLDAPYNGSVDDRSLSYGVNLGLNVTDRVALEAGVRSYNDFNGRGTPCPAGDVCILLIRPIEGNSVISYKLSAVPHFEVGKVELFGEVGYFRAEVDTDIRFPGGDFTRDGLLVGGGARWHLAAPWSVSVKASRMSDDIYQLAVGVGWGLRSGRD